MKRLIWLAVFTAVSVCCKAQFVLTPSAGLMTEDGPYVISRNGSEAENYEAAKKAVLSAIPDAKIADLEYEKSFNASSAIKDRRRLAGALVKSDLTIEYTLEVECEDGKVMVSFKSNGPMELRTKKGELFMNIYPTTGSNSMLTQVAGVQHIFNSNGNVAKQCKKIKELYESYMNDIVKSIENNLK